MHKYQGQTDTWIHGHTEWLPGLPVEAKKGFLELLYFIKEQCMKLGKTLKTLILNTFKWQWIDKINSLNSGGFSQNLLIKIASNTF